jgi:hypothetical protein
MILNLTQHMATADQVAAGVVDLPDLQRKELVEALTFTSLPTAKDIADRAAFIADLACQNGLGGDDGDDPHPPAAMIGGASYLMPALEASLRGYGIEPLHAFSVRQSGETRNSDGTVSKTMVFRHQGWVRAA